MDKLMEQLADEFSIAFKKFSDLEGVIIRGHILIEIALNRAIELSIPNKDEYDADRFSFSQKMVLGNMLDIVANFKLELIALNKLRNQIAHSLQFDDKNIDLIIKGVKKRDKEIFEGKETKLECLMLSISYICGYIHGRKDIR